jgi:hypothetical protein
LLAVVYFSALVFAAILSFTEAMIYTNITVPVNINARNGNFNLPPLSDSPAITYFAQNFSRQGGNFSGSILTYKFATTYPGATDGLVLQVLHQLLLCSPTVTAWDLNSAALNQPLRFENTSLSTISSILQTYGLANILASLKPSTIGITGENLAPHT